MTPSDTAFLVVYVAIIVGLAKPLGLYMTAVYEGRRTWLHPVLRPVEAGIYRVSGIHETQEQGWRRYLFTLLGFHMVGFLLLYTILRSQGNLPLNPQDLPGLKPSLAFNTAVSFMTNTNWQSYGGESTMSYFSQMVGLTFQNFVSAAAGMAVLVGAHPRARAPFGKHGRQLLGGHGPRGALHPAAAVIRVRDLPGFAGSHPELRLVQDRHDRRRCGTGIRDGPRCFADCDQAARDKRRRVLQCELRRPVREPDRLVATSSRWSRSF